MDLNDLLSACNESSASVLSSIGASDWGYDSSSSSIEESSDVPRNPFMRFTSGIDIFTGKNSAQPDHGQIEDRLEGHLQPIGRLIGAVPGTPVGVAQLRLQYVQDSLAQATR